CFSGSSREFRTGEFYWDSLWLRDLLPGYAFMSEVLGASAVDELDGLIALARSAGAWIARERVALICERPRVFRVDGTERLHCDDGPALEWRDGTAVYAWHGLTVPARVIERPVSEINITAIYGERNAEFRRVLCERIGYEKLLDS